jgi:sugar phosphate isomerase/epimerase
MACLGAKANAAGGAQRAEGSPVMKLAIQEGLIPGRCLAEKLDVAASCGFEGVEIGGAGLLERADEVVKGIEGHPVAISTICAGFRGCPLGSAKAERDLAFDDMKKLLQLGGEIGAVGLIFVPVFGPPRLPDLSPWKRAETMELDLLVELLGPMAVTAQKAGCLLLLEPLNRYETHLVKRLNDAVAVVKRVRSKGLAVMADFFHMSIEEDDIPAAIRKAGKHIRHVHLADSQRQQPGTGHTAFRAGFKALRESGFSDYMALECGVRGKPAVALPECVQFLKSQLR